MEITNMSTEDLRKELACREEQQKKHEEELRLKCEARTNEEKELQAKISHATRFIETMLMANAIEFNRDPKDHNIFIQTKNTLLKYINEVYLPHRLPGFIAVEAKEMRKVVTDGGVVLEDREKHLGVVITKKEHLDECCRKQLPIFHKPLINDEQAKKINKAIADTKKKMSKNRSSKKK